VVPKVVEAILNLPENTHIAVKYTSVLLLGELCEWIEKHPQTLDPILNFLVCCLPQAGVGAAAAISLQSICATCNDHMPRHVPVLLQLLQQVDTFAITNNAVIGLVKRGGGDRGVHAPFGTDRRHEEAVSDAGQPHLSAHRTGRGPGEGDQERSGALVGQVVFGLQERQREGVRR
jgi:hypothetical protein